MRRTDYVAYFVIKTYFVFRADFDNKISLDVISSLILLFLLSIAPILVPRYLYVFYTFININKTIRIAYALFFV